MNDIVYKLSEPFKFEDKEYTEISLNLKGMGGKDVRNARRALEDPTRVIPILALDDELCSLLAARSAGLPYEFMDQIPASDYMAIVALTQNFFMKSGSYSKEPTVSGN